MSQISGKRFTDIVTLIEARNDEEELNFDCTNSKSNRFDTSESTRYNISHKFFFLKGQYIFSLPKKNRCKGKAIVSHIFEMLARERNIRHSLFKILSRNVTCVKS